VKRTGLPEARRAAYALVARAALGEKPKVSAETMRVALEIILADERKTRKRSERMLQSWLASTAIVTMLVLHPENITRVGDVLSGSILAARAGDNMLSGPILAANDDDDGR
jgi:hypothetical protein